MCKNLTPRTGPLSHDERGVSLPGASGGWDPKLVELVLHEIAHLEHQFHFLALLRGHGEAGVLSQPGKYTADYE